MPWPTEWDDDGRPDANPPRPALDEARLREALADDRRVQDALSRLPRWDVDEIGDRYERGEDV
jgi:hypothetical protein